MSSGIALSDGAQGAVPQDRINSLVLRNAIALAAAYVLPRGALFVSTIVAARVLGGPAFGAYVTAGALAVILSIIASAGMHPLLVRDMSRDAAAAHSLLATAHRAKAVTVAAMLAATLFVATIVLRYPPALVAAIMALAVAYAIGSWCENYGAWFQARERMHVWTQATTIFGVVSAVAGIGAVLATRSIVLLCVAQIAGQAAALAWLARAYRKDAGAIGGVPAASVTHLLRNAVPFAAAFLALTLFYKVDLLIIERVRGSGEAGSYGAAYRLVDVAVALALAGIGAAFPRLARRAGAPGYARRAFLLCVCIALPASLLCSAAAPSLIAFLFGDAYAGSAVVLSILAIALPALACNLLAGYLLGAEGAIRIMAVTYAGGVAAKVLLAAVLVPVHGAVGAAAAMASCEVALCGVFVLVLHRRGTLRAPASVMLAVAVPALFAGLLKVLA